MTPKTSHSALVSAIQRSDRAAEAELVAFFLPRVRAFLFARLRNPDAVSDLSQDVMMFAIAALREGRLREPEVLPSFIYGIARNHLSGTMRKQDAEKLDPLLTDFPDTRAIDWEEKERLAQARQAIDSLDPTDRRILLLTLVDGQKPGDIAKTVGLNSEVVRQRKSRALKKVIEMVRARVTKHLPLPLTKGTMSNPEQP